MTVILIRDMSPVKGINPAYFFLIVTRIYAQEYDNRLVHDPVTPARLLIILSFDC